MSTWIAHGLWCALVGSAFLGLALFAGFVLLVAWAGMAAWYRDRPTRRK